MNKKICFSLFNKFGYNHKDFNDLAIATKFKSRFRTLMAFDFLFTFLVSSVRNCVSYNSMARNLSSLGDATVSKQALHKAMARPAFLLFIQMIFKNLLAEKLKKTLLRIYGSINYLKEYSFRTALLSNCQSIFSVYFPAYPMGSHR